MNPAPPVTRTFFPSQNPMRAIVLIWLRRPVRQRSLISDSKRCYRTDGDASLPSAKIMAPKKILVVDDEPVIRKVLERFFSQQGIIVRTACNGAEALEILKTDRPDVLLMDARMPVLNGIETLRQLQKMKLGIFTVIMTGSGDPELAQKVTELGASDFINKPIDLEALASSGALARWLAEAEKNHPSGE
jgi:two-component system response regulator (stage 0 sporulation protein F)